MKDFFTRIHIACLFLLSVTGMFQAQAQTSVFQSTSRRIIYAYEGFDYFGGTRTPVQAGQNPSSINNPATPGVARATEASQATTTGLSLHNINTVKSNTNSYHALGWAGDWIASNGGSTPYQLSTTPVTNIITSPKAGGEKFSLVNSGFYATIAAAGGGTIGRRLQTSTGGYFYEYEIFNEAAQGNGLDANYTAEYWYRGGINAQDRFARTLSASTIRTLGSTGRAVHKVTEATSALPTAGQNPRSGTKYTGKTYTSNTCIGANGSTIWMGFLMRLNADASNNEDAYINLNRSANPYTVDNAKVSIGYFGTTDAASFGTGATKRWGIRVGGVSYVSPLALGDAADSSTVQLGKFTLLVVSITFDYSGNNTVKLFTINDGSASYDDFTADGIIDEPATPTATFTISGDLSFHSVAYNGGNSIGRSDIDEIRFARSFDLAALASQTISLVRDLCESDLDADGQVDAIVGSNVNANGDLGYSALDGNGVDADFDGTINTNSSTDEQVGTSSDYSTTYDPTLALGSIGNRTTNVEDRVIFKKGSALLGGVRYDALAPGFTYNINANGQPNDGNYFVATQSRTPFGNVGGLPVWINAYDNSGDKLGNMMVINASYDRSLYFQQSVSGVCPGTQYEFYADILNLFARHIKSVTNLSATTTNYNCGCYTDLEPGCGQFSFSGTDQANSDGLGGATQTADWQLPASVTGTLECFALNPEIEFLIDGVPVYIPPISINNDEKWHRIGFTFVTKNTNTITVAVRNRAPGGNGNDLAMDNFIFRPCGPALNRNAEDFCQIASPGTTKLIQYTPKGKTYRRPYYRWVIQKCTGNCTDPSPAARTYDPMVAVVGGQAFYDPDVAELNVDTLAGSVTYPTSNFNTLFPGGVIPQGSIISVYSASESDANTQDSNCRIAGSPSSAACDVTTLPVHLLEFKARPETGTIRLDWKTIKEKDLKEFVIERSVNGYDFVPIGTVSAQKITKEIKSYLYYDMNPVEGNAYYRLKLVNEDNSYQYSKIETVHIRLNYRVHPVPADHTIIVSLIDQNTKNRNVRIRIQNLLGNAAFENEYTLPAGQTDIEIPVSALQSGVYVIEIRDGNSLDKKRIVINR